VSDDKIVSQLVQEDPEFADIVEQFVDGLSNRVATMTQALSGRDFDALRVAAHQLKGSAGGYGYPSVTEKAAELERAARISAFDDCRNHLAQLEAMCGRVIVGADQHA